MPGDKQAVDIIVLGKALGKVNVTLSEAFDPKTGLDTKEAITEVQVWMNTMFEYLIRKERELGVPESILQEARRATTMGGDG